MKLVYCFLVFFLISCGTQKGTWVTNDYPIEYQLLIPATHHHVCDSTGCYCFYTKEMDFSITDTIRISYYRYSKKEIKELSLK